MVIDYEWFAHQNQRFEQISENSQNQRNPRNNQSIESVQEGSCQNLMRQFPKFEEFLEISGQTFQLQ